MRDQAQVEADHRRAVIEAETEGHKRWDAGERHFNVEIMAPEPNFMPAYFLYGLAIENGLKGSCLYKDSTLAVADRLNHFICTHDLNELASRAGVEISECDKNALLNLSNIIQWAGRYPVAKNLSSHFNAVPIFQEADQLLGDWDVARANLRDLFHRCSLELRNRTSGNNGYGVLVYTEQF